MRRAVAVPAWEKQISEVIALLEPAAELYSRLLLVVGKGRTGKSTVLQGVSVASGGTIINVGLALTKELLTIEPRLYPLKAPGMLSSLVRDVTNGPVLLDNTDILFDRLLKVDPLMLLQKAAHGQTVVAAWRGHVERSMLYYAQPGHRDARAYLLRDVLVVDLNSGTDA